MTRRGTTLFEVILALVTLGLLTGASVTLLRSVAAAAAMASHRLAHERDATAIGTLMIHDLQHAADTAVHAPASGGLEYDRPVGEGVACDLVSGTPLVRASTWHGARLPAPARDEIEVLVHPDPAAWQRRRLAAVGAATCPDGSAALELAGDMPLSAAIHVRVVEPVRIRRYHAGGSEWLGMEHRWNGTLIQPFAGPLAPSGATWSHTPGILGIAFRGTIGVTAMVALPLE